MSGRGPDPKDLRASVVDSGWSAPPPDVDPEATLRTPRPTVTDESTSRLLPAYEDQAQGGVTQIDADLQTRLRAMQRVSLSDLQAPPPPLPPPPRARSAAPPPPSPPPSLPPPPSFPPPLARPQPPMQQRPMQQPPPSRPSAPKPVVAVSAYESHDTTEVGARPEVLPPSDPPAQQPIPRAPMPASASLMPAPDAVSPAPSLAAALRQRVRFAGGEVPLVSLLMPMVLLLVLGSAFVAVAFLTPERAASATPSSSATAPVSVASASPPPPSSSNDVPAPEASTTSQTPALPAASIDTEALEARRAEELTESEALALAAGRQKRALSRAAELRRKVSRDPGLFKDPATLSELRRAAEDPLTAPDALGAMADAPGALSADLLYEMWTGSVARTSATELARSLVFSKEVRAKASPELAVALDLRIAETCEQNQKLLPRVEDKGDRRSLPLLAKLARRFGCGANKRQDCYQCLRDDKALDDAMTAVKKRREPRPFSGK